jgi:hypothetical protein
MCLRGVVSPLPVPTYEDRDSLDLPIIPTDWGDSRMSNGETTYARVNDSSGVQG